MVSNLEQRRLSSLGLRKGFLFRGSGWDSWTEPKDVEVEEKGLWKWATLSMGALLGEPGGGAPLSGALKVMKGRLWE
jgi:hypothetical protein